MPEIVKPPFSWPSNSWTILKKIIRAWYAAEQGGNEVSQKRIAQMADAHQSQVSMNKAFLQSIGIVEPEGIKLTEAGKRYGLGLTNENVRVAQQGLQEIIKNCTLLRDLVDTVHARGNVEEADLEAELSLLTKQGKTNAGFATGASVLQGILLDSGEIEKVGTILKINKSHADEDRKSPPPRREIAAANEILPASGLRRIPVPVSAGSIWYVEVAENPDEFEVAKFLDMQKLIFSKTR
jgi:hypothetical protein